MIHHIAVWVSDLEKMRDFYIKYFDGTSNTLYHNQKKHFKSYFLSFDDGSKLELMQSSVDQRSNGICLGYAHIAFSLGSKDRVDSLTKLLAGDSYTVVSGPRITGDGYYESCILDPEGNRVEITV